MTDTTVMSSSISSARSKVMNNWSMGLVTTEAIPSPVVQTPQDVSNTSTNTPIAIKPIVQTNGHSKCAVNVAPIQPNGHQLNGNCDQNGGLKVKSVVDLNGKDIVPKVVPKSLKAKSREMSKIKVIKNRTKPVLVKHFGDQKGFLDFIGKTSIAKEGVPFIQDRSCHELTANASQTAANGEANTTTTTTCPVITHCMDCNDRRSQSQTCRFYQYRTLMRTNGQLDAYAFAEEGNATQDDCKLWLPFPQSSIVMDPITAKYLLTFVGQQFCQIYAEEQQVFDSYVTITWKRPVKGIRELCDVCTTTIFNAHYVCPKCGLAVCVDCMDVRNTSQSSNNHINRKNQDEFGWTLCHQKQRHDTKHFHLALFITKAVFGCIDRISHLIRNQLKIMGICECKHLDPDLNVDMRQSCAHIDLKTIYPHIPQQWYCNDRMLVLSDPKFCDNIKLFQLFWLKGFPAMIENVDKYLQKDIWTPQEFGRKFGKQTSRLVNCMNGSIIGKRPMSDFWNGFEDIDKRIKDEDTGDEMILKLKDWPPFAEFRDILPIWFDDLMEALPLKEYTKYNGIRNIASRLPEFFVRPDLGPKMYCAYGSVLHADKGSTNLHLDMSDAVNVMVYVGVAQQDNKPLESHLKFANETLLKGGCDEQMMQRANDADKCVGALWHIWRAEDAYKMRQFIHKVAKERHQKIDPTSDPIHDQSWYIDETLRKRLETEYDVKGLAIAQCLGDAILVPAGAPHQVQNIHSCIKVAGEFVSPENVGHCVAMTQEFRKLSRRHNNHEDKLQIKNIIYHTIKDCLSVLMSVYPEISSSLAQLWPQSPRPVPPKVILTTVTGAQTPKPPHKPIDLLRTTPLTTDEIALPTPPNSIEKLMIISNDNQPITSYSDNATNNTMDAMDTQEDDLKHEFPMDCQMNGTQTEVEKPRLLSPPLLSDVTDDTNREEKAESLLSPPILKPYSDMDVIDMDSCHQNTVSQVVKSE